MSGKTNRKHRRNKDFCEKYARAGTREFNKELALARHKKNHPNDQPSAEGRVNYTRKKPLSYWETQQEKHKEKQQYRK